MTEYLFFWILSQKPFSHFHFISCSLTRRDDSSQCSFHYSRCCKKKLYFFRWKEETRAILCTFMGILEIDRMREFCENKKLNNNKNSSQTRQSKVIKLKSIWPQYIAWRMRNKVENIKEWGSMWWNQRSKFEQWGFEVVQKWNRKDFFKLEFHKNLTDL